MEITSATQLIEETKKRFLDGTYTWGKNRYFDSNTNCLCLGGGLAATMGGDGPVKDSADYQDRLKTSGRFGNRGIFNDAWRALGDLAPSGFVTIANDRAQNFSDLIPLCDQAIEALER